MPSAPIAEAMPSADPEESLLIPVVCQGRYTLAELVPTAAQRDLLIQVVDVALPQGVQATVGDRLRLGVTCYSDTGHVGRNTQVIAL